MGKIAPGFRARDSENHEANSSEEDIINEIPEGSDKMDFKPL